MISTLLLAIVPCAPAQESITVTAENLTVTIEKGKIVGVSGGGRGAIAGSQLTPGLVDAYTFLGVDEATVEHSREITAGQRVADSARLDSSSCLRAAGEGVTTAYVSPDSLNVIGGLGAVVKTAGGRSADLFAESGAGARVIQAAGGLRIVIGIDAFFDNRTPSGEFTTSSHARRPTTRMGSVWEIRNAFFTAAAYRAAKKERPKLYDRDLEALVGALEGRIPVRVLARKHHDVQTALRIKDEFKIPLMIIEEATEGYLVRDLLRDSGVPVVTGPAADLRARSVARGPSFDDLRAAAELTPICCEHVHEENPYLDHSIPDETYGRIELPPYLRDLFLLTAPRYGFASGFEVGRFREAESSTPALAALLSEAGVFTVLGAGEAYDFEDSEAGAIQQARTAARWGMPREAALAAVTSQAAELIGVGDRVGKLEVGYDGDLVLWSGDPLDPSSRPLLVVVDGRVVLDQRPKN